MDESRTVLVCHVFVREHHVRDRGVHLREREGALVADPDQVGTAETGNLLDSVVIAGTPGVTEQVVGPTFDEHESFPAARFG